MKRLGIIAAFPGELRPLVRGWREAARSHGDGQPAAWQGVLGTTECVAVAAGMGREAAARACRFAEGWGAADGRAPDGPVLEGLVSYGWAGAISCGMRAAEAYEVAEVVDASTGERFAVSLPAPSGTPLRLVTIDHVAQGGEKRALAERYQAVLVDMEASVVAQFAREKGIAFYCLKAVSDTASDMLPDFSRFSDTQGGLRMPALLAHLALRPRYWRSAARMGKNSKNGAAAAARALRERMEADANHAGR